MFPQLKLIEWIIAGALLIGAAIGGWTVNGWRLGKQIDELKNTYLAQANAAQVKYAAGLKQQADTNEEAAQAHEEAQGKLESRLTALRAQLAKERHNYVAPHSTTGTVASCDVSHPFTTDLPRDINRLSDVADGTSVPAAAPSPPDTAQPPAGPSPTSEITGDTIVRWYAEVATLYGKCRQALADVKQWDKGETP